MKKVLLCVIAVVCAAQASAQANDGMDAFSRKNTWTLFAEYSNDSSHILLGVSHQRKIADFGGAYARRLFRAKGNALSYQVEVRPVVLESDPVSTLTFTETATTGSSAGETYTGTQMGPALECHPYTDSGTVDAQPPTFPGYTYVEVQTCSRRWTFAQQFSPVGFKYSFGTRHAIQPFAVGTVGYMYSNKPIPVADAGSFNFTFDFGGGVEVFRSKTRSVSLECRFHHFSNKYTADANPGVDSLIFKASYSFGH
jgi:hypothetical protein